MGLNPPRIKAVVIVLPADLAVSELEPNGEVSSHLRVGGKSVDGNGEVSAPENFERDDVALSDGVEDVVLLGTHRPLPLSRGVEKCFEVAMHADRREPIRKLFLDDIVGEELSQRTALGAVLESYEGAAC